MGFATMEMFPLSILTVCGVPPLGKLPLPIIF
jgi:hypothetical protein